VGFHRFKKTFKDLMRVNLVIKRNIFLNEDESDSAKRLSGTQKVKFDIDVLGCVECSTYPMKTLHLKRMYTPPCRGV
jgi:hypothetical protein